MIGLFENLRFELDAFLEGNGHGVMIASAAGMQIGYVIKTLKEIEDAGSPDVFLVFPQNFVSPDDFANQVVERVSLSYEAARDELGLTPSPNNEWETKVTAMRDERRPAVERIRESLCLARTLLPTDSDKRIVFGAIPLNCDNPIAYTELVRQLTVTDSSIPWFYGMRILVGEDAKSEIQSERFAALAGRPHVIRKSFDFSTDAIMSQLEEETQNPDASEAEQAQSTLQLAMMDHAHDRPESAIERFHRVLPFFQRTNNPSMQAMVMTGLGDVYRRLGNSVSALAWYERALLPAAESKSPIVVYSLGKTLGQHHYEQREYAQAEEYFDGCQQVGPTTNDPSARIDALLWRGLTQMKREAYGRASESFEEAAAVCREFERNESLRRILENLRDARRGLGELDRIREIEQELALLPLNGEESHAAN